MPENTQHNTTPENPETGRAEGAKARESLLALVDNGSHEKAAERLGEEYRAEGKKAWEPGVNALARALKSGKKEGFNIKYI